MPCGTSFVIDKVSEISPGAIKVELKQTEQVLMDLVSTEVDVFRHPALAELAAALDADPAGTDSVQRHFEFHQPLPPGFLAVVLSRCAKQCTEATSVWRRELLTALRGDPGEDDGDGLGDFISLGWVDDPTQQLHPFAPGTQNPPSTTHPTPGPGTSPQPSTLNPLNPQPSQP